MADMLYKVQQQNYNIILPFCQEFFTPSSSTIVSSAL
jgi:hypothetical protein